RIVGEYDASVTFGQRRVLLVWNRLIFPDGRSLVLERLPGTDASGYAGLEDGVDYHWGDLMKAAGLSTILAIGTELAAGDEEDRLVRAIRDGGQDTVDQAGQQIVQRQLQVAPTLTIRPGFPVRILVGRDLVFESIGGRQ
ncbi:TrbI/VirB10 family protein, partial [Paracoccus pantotrophus]